MSSASAGRKSSSSIHRTDTHALSDWRVNAPVTQSATGAGAERSTYTVSDKRTFLAASMLVDSSNTAFTSMGSCMTDLLPYERFAGAPWAHTDPISPSMTKLTTMNDEP